MTDRERILGRRRSGEMGKWVTFYESIFSGIQDYVEHPDKETAEKYFKAHYRYYFQIAPATQVKLPMAYGFYHRKYYGMSLRMFKKRMAEKKG